MKIDLEFEWDHGPDLTLVIYAKRTHILSVSYSAYPVLGGANPAAPPVPPVNLDPFMFDDLHWQDLGDLGGSDFFTTSHKEDPQS